MTCAFVFPGQGSQAVGMGKDFYDNSPIAKAVFDEVDDVLAPLYGHKLSTFIFEGPSATLTDTRYAQAALMTTSMAIFRGLEYRLQNVTETPLQNRIAFMAGHSLGEYSALCAAGVLSLKDTAYLLYHRGKAMAECVAPVVANDEEGDSAAPKSPMAALMGLDIEVIERITKESKCYIANDNGGGQIVLSGTYDAIAHAMELAQSTGAKRVVPLNVSAPFHCPLMQDAATYMAEKLNDVTFHDASIPVVTNVSALPQTKAPIFKEHLLEQICGRVRWRETALFLGNHGVKDCFEIGSGKVLTGLCKRVTADVNAYAMNTMGDVDLFLSHVA